MDYSFLTRGNERKPSRVGIVGATKGFGYTLLAQLPCVDLLSLRLICSRHADECRDVLEEVGYDTHRIVFCNSSEEVKQAVKREDAIIIVGDYRLVLDSDITALVECTGSIPVDSDIADKALDQGINVYMVSKETDSVCGPYFNDKAYKNNAVYALVNGDQPRNLVDLVSWARLLGLEIIAAGKSSEYDFVFDPETNQMTYLDFTANIPEMQKCWHYTGTETLEMRKKLVKEQATVISADLCEMNLVSNVTGFVPASPFMHYPVAKTSELADIFVPIEDGGILEKTGVVDVFYDLHAPDEASFGGGEFIIVACKNRKVWELMREKGHVVSRNGKYACLYAPYHIMGVETPTSIILGNQLGIGTQPECRQVSVLAGIAETTLKKGTMLEVKGHHHSIDGLTPTLLETSSIAGTLMPFYLLNNAVLKRDVPAGSPITDADVEIVTKAAYEMYQKGLALK